MSAIGLPLRKGIFGDSWLRGWVGFTRECVSLFWWIYLALFWSGRGDPCLNVLVQKGHHAQMLKLNQEYSGWWRGPTHKCFLCGKVITLKILKLSPTSHLCCLTLPDISNVSWNCSQRKIHIKCFTCEFINLNKNIWQWWVPKSNGLVYKKPKWSSFNFPQC